MFYRLNKRQIKAFIKKYFNEYDEFVKDIRSISCISYKGIKEYRINNIFTLRIYN